mgnify:CR=1 FL=1
MSLTTKQILFYLLLLLSWLLLLFFGESHSSYILIGVVSLFLLLFSNELEWKRSSLCLIFSWLFFLTSISLSLYFSINLPLSLYSVTRYIFVFLTFWFFFLVKKSFVSSQQIIKLLVFTTFPVMLVSVVAYFFPQSLSFLSEVKLFQSTYGHNHVAALLLLIIPLSWWQVSEYIKLGRSSWWWLLPVGFTLGLLASFGRVTVAIGLLQFMFIYRHLIKDGTFKKSKLNFIIRIIFSLFSLVLLVNVFFSTVSLVSPEFTCPVPVLEKQLCKSIKTESRPRYWKWAIETMKDHPLIGSGPGTYSIVVKKYRSAFYNSTSYAHNVFLQAGAELGVIGGSLFSLLMLTLLYLSWRSLKRENIWGWRKASFLGISSIYINVLFDFDWDFVGVFSITLILLALLIKDEDYILASKWTRSFFKILYLTLFFVIILVAALYLEIDGLIREGNTSQAFDLFPYFHWHRKTYENSSKLSRIDREELFYIYTNHPDIYPIWLAGVDEEQERQLIKEKWFEVDPWSAATRDLVSFYLDQQEWSKAKERLEKVSAMYSYPVDIGLDPDYEQMLLKIEDQQLAIAVGLIESGDYPAALSWLEKVAEKELRWDREGELATLLVEVGNELSLVDMKKTVKAYELAKERIPWILSINDLWFERFDVDDIEVNELATYLELTADWEGEEIGFKDEMQRTIVEKYELGENLKL